jgi:hypothetical protein
MSAATILVPGEGDVMARAEDDAAREIAERLEQEHPLWIVIFGSYTKEFICFPRFATLPQFMVVALYPKAAAERMHRAEQLYKIWKGPSTWET